MDCIIGTTNDINNITKEVLYSCYNTFYHPKNMFLVVTGSFDKEEILQAIILNQSKKEFRELTDIKIKKYDEPDEVVKEKEIINIKTPISKVSYNIKISLKDIDMDVRKYNLYLFIIFSILFDDTSLFDEEMRNDGTIANSIYLNILNCDTHLLISLINETDSYDKLITQIESTLKNIEISNEDLERKKRVLISNELFSFENIEVINEMIIDNIIFENKIESNIIGLLKSLNKEELDSIINNLNLENKSVVILKYK